jgi:hypothetical protein
LTYYDPFLWLPVSPAANEWVRRVTIGRVTIPRSCRERPKNASLEVMMSLPQGTHLGICPASFVQLFNQAVENKMNKG